MGAYQKDVYFMGATVLNLSILGASVFPTAVKPPAGCVGMQIKALSGGTIQILPNAGTSGVSIGGATAAISGYPLALGTDMFITPGPAAFYMAATGSSGTVAINFMFSAGGASLA
jgi:hypothetical protein